MQQFGQQQHVCDCKIFPSLKVARMSLALFLLPAHNRISSDEDNDDGGDVVAEEPQSVGLLFHTEKPACCSVTRRLPTRAPLKNTCLFDFNCREKVFLLPLPLLLFLFSDIARVNKQFLERRATPTQRSPLFLEVFLH